MTREEIIMALICCAEGKTEWCKKCPLYGYDANCCAVLAREALTELKASTVKLQELTAEVERLKRSYRIAVQDNADTCQLLFKAEDEVKELKCQVERMRDSLRYEDSLLTSIITTARIGIALEMANRLKASAEIRDGIKFNLVSFDTIDQIAKEMVGETK